MCTGAECHARCVCLYTHACGGHQCALRLKDMHGVFVVAYCCFFIERGQKCHEVHLFLYMPTSYKGDGAISRAQPVFT